MLYASLFKRFYGVCGIFGGKGNKNSHPAMRQGENIYANFCLRVVLTEQTLNSRGCVWISKSED